MKSFHELHRLRRPGIGGGSKTSPAMPQRPKVLVAWPEKPRGSQFGLVVEQAECIHDIPRPGSSLCHEVSKSRSKSSRILGNDLPISIPKLQKT